MTMLNETDRGFRLTGRHVLIAMLAFFGIVVGVNITFVHLALSTWTGLTDHDSYRTGLSWNRTLEQDAAQKALGWTTDIDSRSAWSEASQGWRLAVTLVVRDAQGRPVDGLVIDGEARHPVAEADDRTLTFAGTPGGVYAGTAILPGAGNWELKLIATAADGSVYRTDTVAAVR